jgi:hypothetical protein
MCQDATSAREQTGHDHFGSLSTKMGSGDGQAPCNPTASGAPASGEAQMPRVGGVLERGEPVFHSVGIAPSTPSLAHQPAHYLTHRFPVCFCTPALPAARRAPVRHRPRTRRRDPRRCAAPPSQRQRRRQTTHPAPPLRSHAETMGDLHPNGRQPNERRFLRPSPRSWLPRRGKRRGADNNELCRMANARLASVRLTRSTSGSAGLRPQLSAENDPFLAAATRAFLSCAVFCWRGLEAARI